MKKFPISFSLIALLCANANADSPDVLNFDALGNKRVSEYNISKSNVTLDNPELTFSEDGTELIITTTDAIGVKTSTTTTLTEGSICTFSKYYNGIGDDNTDLQLPDKDYTANVFLIQNAGNFASMINGLESGLYPLGTNFLQTSNIYGGDVTVGCVSKEFAGTYKLEDDALYLDDFDLTSCINSADVFPFKTADAYVKMNYNQARIELPSGTKVVADAFLDGDAADYTLCNATFSSELPLTDQYPIDATSVRYAGDSRFSGTMTPGYTSLCLPFDLSKNEVPDEVYTYSSYEIKQEGDDTNCYVTLESVDTSNGIAANTPVIFKSKGGYDVSLADKELSLSEPESSTTKAGIWGSFSDKLFEDATAFGIVSDGKTLDLLDTNPAYGAYVCIPDELYSNYYVVFKSSGVDGIDADKAQEDATVDVYNTQGALVGKSIKRSAVESSLERGLYMLSNGEKVCVK